MPNEEHNQGLPGPRGRLYLTVFLPRAIHSKRQIDFTKEFFMAKQTTAKKEQEQTAHVPIKVITVNRQAYHDYTVERTIEAGISLVGTEIKSIREGKVNLRGSYAIARRGEIWLENAHIATYEQGNRYNHEPLRNRKLLLHKREINQLVTRVATKGLTLVPLKLYLKGGKAKLEIGLCRGKKLYDKRDAIAERDVKRDIERIVRGR
jgi:SsrA-binding protein